ncbi:hypothetical protein ACU8NH_09015 [Rhizobium leguminosarum]
MNADPNYTIDKRWPDYSDPETAVAHLVQQPLYKIDGLALADAVMRDWRAKRSAERETVERITAEMHAEARALLAGRPKKFGRAA